MKRLLVLLLVLFLVGCGGRGGGDEGTDVVLQTGTEGITVSILKDKMPDSVHEQETIAIPLEVRNEGFNDVRNGILVPIYEQDIVSLDRWDADFSGGRDGIVRFDLKGKSLSNTRGEFAIPYAVFSAKKIDEKRNKMKTSITMNSCFAYFTTFSDTICIDTDPFDTSIAEKSCTAKDLSGSSQGAPIAITQVNQQVLPGRDSSSVGLEIIIHAENKGKGDVIDFRSFDDICRGSSRGLSSSHFNTLELVRLQFSWYEYDGHFGSEDFDCSPNPATERKGEYIVRCRLKEENAIPTSQFSFETPIIVELAYGYKVSDSVNLEVISKTAEIR